MSVFKFRGNFSRELLTARFRDGDKSLKRVRSAL
ncbi:hypothetical protein ACVWZX_000713 [Deinococcus sp. UYEF24]